MMEFTVVSLTILLLSSVASSVPTSKSTIELVDPAVLQGRDELVDPAILQGRDELVDPAVLQGRDFEGLEDSAVSYA
jgi:hypothetical protein